MRVDLTRDHRGIARKRPQPDGATPAWMGVHTLRADDMIAAAPDMLDLLKKVQVLIDAGIDIGVDGVYLRQVIDKAEGHG